MSAFASVYVTWTLGQISLRPPSLPEWLPFTYVAYLFLIWVVLAGACAVWPAAKLLRIACTINLGFCCYIDHLHHGWWAGFVSLFLGSVVFAFSQVSQKDGAEQREGALAWIQILLCGYLGRHLYYVWLESHHFWKQALLGACFMLLGAVLLQSLLRPRQIRNGILPMLGVILIFYFAFSWSDDAIPALALALAVPLIRHHLVDGRWTILSDQFYAR